MVSFVKIVVADGDGCILEHFYIKDSRWGAPAGRLEKGERAVHAARRELLERTGYDIAPECLTCRGEEKAEGVVFKVFSAQKNNLKRVAKPGEAGGYSTKIRWKKRI
jgi:8-oxo-dGTP pyrophosphatase MutT (NUDIX family)